MKTVQMLGHFPQCLSKVYTILLSIKIKYLISHIRKRCYRMREEAPAAMCLEAKNELLHIENEILSMCESWSRF